MAAGRELLGMDHVQDPKRSVCVDRFAEFLFFASLVQVWVEVWHVC